MIVFVLLEEALLANQHSLIKSSQELVLIRDLCTYKVTVTEKGQLKSRQILRYVQRIYSVYSAVLVPLYFHSLCL